MAQCQLPADTSVEVDLKNRLSSAFILANALIVIDDKIVFGQEDASDKPRGWPSLPASPVQAPRLADRKDVAAYCGRVPPGAHTIQIRLGYQGNGDFYRHLGGYWFDVRTSHRFTLADGQTIRIAAVAFEKGGPTTPLEMRLAVDWSETPDSRIDGGVDAGAAPDSPFAL